MVKYLLLVSLLFFNGCKKDYITFVYDDNILNEAKKCMRLKLDPFSNSVYHKINKLYNFNHNCKYILKLRYKTKIACNSPYKKTDKFNSFIEYSLYKDEKLVATFYLDTNEVDFNDNLTDFFYDVKKQMKF